MSPNCLIACSAALLFAGCAATKFTAYEGNAARQPVSEGAFVNRDYQLPIYEAPPPQPYILIGMVKVSDRFLRLERPEHAAVRVARAQGADALIRLRKGRYRGISEPFLPWVQSYAWRYGYGRSPLKEMDQADFLAICLNASSRP